MSSASMRLPVQNSPTLRAAPVWVWALALGAGLLTLILSLPANWLAGWVAQRSGGHIILADASGTLWRGNAVLSFAADSASFSLPGRLEWRLQMPRRWRIPLQFSHEGVLAQPLQLRLGWNAVQLEAGSASLPLALTTLAGAPLNTLRLQGMARLEWNAMNIALNQNDGAGAASGIIHLDDVASDINPAIASVRPLGAYRINWQSDPAGKLQWQALTVSGPLLIEGQGDSSGHFSGRAMIAAGTLVITAQRLQPLLNVLGRRVNGAGNEQAVTIQIGGN